MSSFISLKEVYFKYENEDKTSSEDIISDINLEIVEGEFLVIIGHNGSGKSTLSKMLNAMILPTKGKVLVEGMDASNDELKYEIRSKVGLIFQNPDNQLVASIVEEDVAFGPENLGVEPNEIRRRVDEALKTVGMFEYRKQAPHKLSGGQKQRVSIAGVLAMKPKCIVLDEPTSMLDPKGRKEVLDTIKKLNKEKNITIILITHYMDEAVNADRIVVMDSGKILLQGKPRDIFSDVELLKKHYLDVPQATDIVHRLTSHGLSLPKGVLDEEECIAALQQLLEDKRCL